MKKDEETTLKRKVQQPSKCCFNFYSCIFEIFILQALTLRLCGTVNRVDKWFVSLM